MSCPFIPAENSALISESVTTTSNPLENLIQATTVASAKDLVNDTVEVYQDENERKLAEYVAKVDGNRKTTGGSGFKRTQQSKIDSLIGQLLGESLKIEDEIFVGENELFHKNEEAFFILQDERELANLKARQSEEIKALKTMQETGTADMTKRKATKKFLRQQSRETKALYNRTHEQEAACKQTQDEKQTLCDDREKSARLVEHMEERHLKQIKQFNAAEERKISDQRILVELKIRHLTEEHRADAMKEFHSKMNYQKDLDKKKLDQICEFQRIELRHFKDKVDLETQMIEELQNLHSKHEVEEKELAAKQKIDYLLEKERIATTELSLKVIIIQAKNLIELKKLQNVHRLQLRQLRKAQKGRKTKRLKHWSIILGRDLTQKKRRTGSALQSSGGSNDGSEDGSESGSVGTHSKPESLSHTRQGSDSNIKHAAGAKKNSDSPRINLIEAEEDDDDSHEKNVSLDTQQQNAEEQLNKMREQLSALREQQFEKLRKLKKKASNEKKEKEEEFQRFIMELEWQQDVDIKDLKKNDETELQEAIQAQERELEMEAHIRGAETKAMLERKVLKSLLDSVVDGVVSIDPRGFIQRFNASAEKMFGYTDGAAINKNIKELMPPEYRENHDDHLYNYLKTGVKKAIGRGVQVKGQRQDGTIFPIHVSVSEVMEDGFHLFTAIIRDLTVETQNAIAKQAEDDCLPQLIWKIDIKGVAMSFNKKFINYTGVQSDHLSTVNFFSPDIIHLEDLKSSKETFLKSNKGKMPFELKMRIKSAEGNYKWFLTRGTPMFDVEGNIQFWCGSCTDINASEILQMELSVLPNSITAILWHVNNEGELLYANPRYKEVTGIDYSTLKIDIFSSEVVHKDDVAKSISSFTEALKHKTSFEVTSRFKSENGNYRWYLIKGTPSFSSAGDVDGFYGTSSDVHGSHSIQDELLIFPENLPQLIWKCDCKGNTLYTNSKFRNFVGIDEGQKFNVFTEALLHPDDLKPSKESFAKANKEKVEFEFKTRLQSENGEYKKFRTLAVPVINDKGDVTAWYASSTQY
ncbi:hypothetical protein HK099_003401 [Clydaea vesicula]|uniref:histidine kinase n=1 Tax=Clydaea vesicula TaxID=447962 RepID=A0AAD5U3K5_9FUNG|nr:hypothetical protein HK099_003401 [Clydaea vesicula]